MGIQERREREKENRKEQIIKTAIKEFAKSGIRNSSIKDIAQKAEISPRTIYSYFSNKRELYGAVLLRGLKILSKEIEKIAIAENDPVESVKSVKEAYGSFYRLHRDYFRIMMYLGFHDVYEEVNPKMCQEISDSVMGCIRRVAEIIKKGQEKGRIREGDPRRLSWSLWSLFMGVGHINEAKHSLNVGKTDFEELFDFAFRSLMRKENATNEDTFSQHEKQVLAH